MPSSPSLIVGRMPSTRDCARAWSSTASARSNLDRATSVRTVGKIMVMSPAS